MHERFDSENFREVSLREESKSSDNDGELPSNVFGRGNSDYIESDNNDYNQDLKINESMVNKGFQCCNSNTERSI